MEFDGASVIAVLLIYNLFFVWTLTFAAIMIAFRQ
jgi:hypothetical protein